MSDNILTDTGKVDEEEKNSASPNFNQFSSSLYNSLLGLTNEIMNSLDLGEVLTKLSKQAKNLLGADWVAVALLQDKLLIGLNYPGIKTEHSVNFVTRGSFLTKGLGGKAYETGKTIVCNDYWNDATFEHDAEMDRQTQNNGVVAAMMIPIRVEGEIVALMGVYKNQPYQWSKLEQAQAEQVASLAIAAIQNARMYQRLQTLNKDLQARNQELESLQQFNHQLREPIELKAVAERALALTIEVTRADSGLLYVLNEKQPAELELLASTCTVSSDPNVRIKPGTGISGKVVESGQTRLIENLAELIEQSPEITLDQNPFWRSGLFVPLKLAEKSIGVMILLTPQPNYFSAEQVRFVEMMANQVASVIEQFGRLEIQKERDQLAAVLTLARTAAHEISQPLTVLQAELDLALLTEIALDTESMEQMQQAVVLITNLIRQYQALVRFQTVEAVPGISVIDYKSSQL